MSGGTGFLPAFHLALLNCVFAGSSGPGLTVRRWLTAELVTERLPLYLGVPIRRPARADSVLLIEDDAPLRELYRAALKTAGFAVTAVGDGRTALEHVDHWRPSAVVLDLALPYVGGRDVHHELKARPETSRIPVVVVTGTDTSDLNPTEFASLLMKPVEPERLVWIVENAIRRARARSAEAT